MSIAPLLSVILKKRRNAKMNITSHDIDSPVIVGFLIFAICAVVSFGIVGYKTESVKGEMVVSCKGDIVCIKEVAKVCGDLK